MDAESDDEGRTERNNARSALDRAHRAARDLAGGDLRRALEDARDCLAAACARPDPAAPTRAAAEKVVQALADLDAGPLDEAERLIEEARTALGVAPEDAPGRA